MKLFMLYIFLIINIIIKINHAQNLCLINVAGKEFDFTSISQQYIEVDYIPEDKLRNHYLVYFNPCTPLVIQDCPKNTGNANIVMMSIYGCNVYGNLQNTIEWKPIRGNPNLGIFATFEAASQGDTECTKRTATLQILNDANDLKDITDTKCNLNIIWHTPLAISKPSGQVTNGGGAIPSTTTSNNPQPVVDPEINNQTSFTTFQTLLLIVLVILSLYCAFGVILNIRNEGRIGLDAIPHKEFWFALPQILVQLSQMIVEKFFDFVRYMKGTSSSSSSPKFNQFTGTMNNNDPEHSYQNAVTSSSGSAPVSVI